MINFYINAIGVLKNNSIRDLMCDYKKRTLNNIEIHEFELKKTKNLSIDIIKEQESKMLLSCVAKNSYLTSMDEKGELLSSRDFAHLISAKTLQVSSFVFFIGGAEGLHKNVLDASDKIISFGRITLPHMLARLILVEQIYRAERIILNHPYDK